MKNLAKIFVTVVAAMAAYACATDTTDDLGVQLGNSAGQTTLTLSIEESRTQLGEKTGNLYPVTWCEDDVVAANGVKSTAIEIKGNGDAAIFTFASDVTRPYSLVYPAPADGVTAATEGLQVVTFLAEQAYAAGTFCDGAAPMYGYAAEVAEGEEVPAIQLHHLTGVLRFALKGAHTLASMTIATESGKIAGNFDLDCTTGVLTAHEDAVNTVAVTFGEGLPLTDEATPIYVAVPAGEYGIVTVTLTSTDAENNTMVVRFNSDYHPVKAATVKEFGTITFVPGATTKPSGELIITNQADLLKLAKWSENKMLDEVTKVTVANEIDMSGVTNWHGIELFPAIIFDGGNKAIKGLTAPLFGTLDGATIQNVKLTEVNITETESFVLGSLVRVATGATINNCSAVGTIEYNNPTSVEPTATTFGVGGLVGQMLVSGSLTNSTNSVNLTMTRYTQASSGNAYIGVGGLVGYAQATSKDVRIAISDCKNLGNITSYQKGKVRPSLAGIVGYATAYIDIDDVVNGEKGNTDKGNITFKESSSCFIIGGVVGAIKNCYVDYATNYGAISIQAAVQYPYVGGVLGSWWASSSTIDYTLTNMVNNGPVSMTCDKVGAGTPYFGGVIGRHASTSGKNLKLKDCTNNADITINAKFEIGGNNAHFGGIMGGGNNIYLDNCDNNGSVNLTGTINTADPKATYNTSTSKTTVSNPSYLYVGGIVGQLVVHSDDKTGEKSEVTDCDNNGSISITTDAMYGCIGGIGGTVAVTKFENCNNLSGGDISVDGTFRLNVGVCGLASSLGCATNNCSNAGDITMSASETEGVSQTGSTSLYKGSIYVNGLSWTSDYAHSNFTNSGKLTFSGQCWNNVFVSGAVYTPTKTITNVHNTGTISANVNDLNCNLEIGGICRTSNSGTYNGCSNSGDIVFKGTSLNTVRLGGFAGQANGAFKTTGEGVTNSGTIKFLGTTTSTAYVGGLTGSATVAISTITTLKNTGLVTNYDAGTGLIGKANTLYVGGCFGRVTSKAQTAKVANEGNIYVRNAEGVYTTAAYIGGVAGDRTVNISNASSVCDIAAIGFTESATAPIVGVGMVVGTHRGSSALVNACTLGGRIAFTEDFNGKPEYKTISAEVIGMYGIGGVFTEDPNYIPYWKKIYGGDWAAATESNCDSCVADESAPAN